MEEERKFMLEQFIAVSGVEQERAKFYLESAAWNIETALESFYDNHEEAPQPMVSEEKIEAKPPSMPMISKNSNDSSSDDEEGQAFYAGGSEHSGQQVLGPSKKKDVVSRLFKSAREHGAEVVDPSEKIKTKKLTFSGTGYRLGETENDHEVIAGASSKQPEPARDVTLKMWKKGFSVDDGPVRAYDDPENSDFLRSVIKGEIPMELIKKAKGGEVFLNMEDHRNEDYMPPKVSVKAFSGAGHSLGSLCPSVVGENSSSMKTTSQSDPKLQEAKAKDLLNTDSEQPTTSIQLRFPDGSRSVTRMNHSHTVGDIRAYVRVIRPELGGCDFAIMTTFPHSELVDDNVTLSDGELLNSSLVVKTK